MRVSITGIILRIFQKGISKRDIISNYEFVLKEFINNFETAKNACENNDMYTVRKFFKIYV